MANMRKAKPTPPIIAAAERGDESAARSILDADPQSVTSTSLLGNTPLHAAALHNHLLVAELLLQRGADINAKGERGKTPLHAAAEGGSVEIMNWLLQHGANVEASDQRGQTPLDTAINHVEVGRVRTQQVVDLLSERGAKAGLRSAIIQGDVVAVRTLLHADPTTLSKHLDPQGLLFLAVVHQQEARSNEIIHLLLDHGVDPNLPGKDWPELPITKVTDPATAALLIQYGACVNVKNSAGHTPLKAARKFKLTALESVLRQHREKPQRSRPRIPPRAEADSTDQSSGTQQRPKKSNGRRGSTKRKEKLG